MSDKQSKTWHTYTNETLKQVKETGEVSSLTSQSVDLIRVLKFTPSKAYIAAFRAEPFPELNSKSRVDINDAIDSVTMTPSDIKNPATPYKGGSDKVH
ncbi:MAG: hypothetical protein LPH21_18455 [Shewanella sp.]|nr:hypothetical protein [Shewanella sp.]